MLLNEKKTFLQGEQCSPHPPNLSLYHISRWIARCDPKWELGGSEDQHISSKQGTQTAAQGLSHSLFFFFSSPKRNKHTGTSVPAFALALCLTTCLPRKSHRNTTTSILILFQALLIIELSSIRSSSPKVLSQSLLLQQQSPQLW